MRVIKIFLLFICLIFIGPEIFATTYYLSPSGNDTYSSAQAQNQGTPWKTFNHSFGAMSAADELILLDGTYSIAAGTGCINWDGTGSGQPPSGTSKSAMTLVRALNPGNVFIDGAGTDSGHGVFIGRSFRVDSYIEIRDITAYGGIWLYNADYCKVKNCGSRGGLAIGAADHTYSSDYNLIEDCWAWAEDARIVAISYEGRYNIWRRVVVRGDGCDEAECAGSGNPNVGITVYNSQNVILENVIVVDRILNGGYPYSDFATAMHTGGANDYPLTGNKWLGCLSFNSEDSAFSFQADSQLTPASYLKDCIAAFNELHYGFNIYGLDTIIENSSVFAKTGNSSGVFYRFDPSHSSGTQVSRNLIGYSVGAASYGIIEGGTTSYVDTYATSFSSDRYYNTTITEGEKTTNPLNDGTPKSVLYPVRIETGSALKGTGYNSGDYGATVIYKYGTDGTFYGDTGYATLTVNALWPWPNETRIKSEMSANYGDNTETRGFAAIGKQLNGTDDITLTSYIWEYLGNEIPADIYGEEPAATAPLSGVTSSGVRFSM